MSQLPQRMPEYRVLINDRQMPNAVAEDLVAIGVFQDVQVPGMFELRLSNWDMQRLKLRWIDDPLFAVGNTVEIALGYRTQLSTLIAGEITGLEPEFVADAPPMLTVRGYDRRHRLMRGRRTRAFSKQKDSAIATEVAKEAGLIATVEDTGERLDYVLQHNQSDMEFLQERAGRIGYEVTVIDQTLFFRARRLKQAPAATLQRERDLLEFFPRLSTMEQVGSFEIRGWDPRGKSEIVAQAVAPPTMGGMTTGSAATTRAFGASSGRLVDLPLQSKDVGSKIAAGQLETLALQYIQGSGLCVGDPAVQAGSVIAIAGLGQRFSGNYYVTAATHRYSAQRGYQTAFEVKRTAT